MPPVEMMTVAPPYVISSMCLLETSNSMSLTPSSLSASFTTIYVPIPNVFYYRLKSRSTIFASFTVCGICMDALWCWIAYPWIK